MLAGASAPATALPPPDATRLRDRELRGHLRPLLVLARWKWTMAVRALAYQVRHTLMGKMYVVVTVVAGPSLFTLVAENHFARVSNNPSDLHGLLVASNLAVVIAFVVGLPGLLAKELVLGNTDEPLVAHPFAAPGVALYRFLVGTFLTAALFLLTFHYIFFGHAFVTGLDNPWVGLPIHAVTSLSFMLVIAVAVGAVCRNLSRRSAVIRRAKLIHGAGVALFMAAWGIPLASLKFIMEGAPEWFAVIGELADRSHDFLLVPLIAAESTNGGAWLIPLGWVIASAVVALVALHPIRAWSRVAHLELSADLDRSEQRRYEPLFSGLPVRSWVWRVVGPFWRKDISAASFRDLRSYFSQQWFFVSSEIGAVVLITVLHRQDALDTPHCAAILLAVLLVSVAALAMIRCLNSLGMEGSQLALLLPAITGAELFFHKGFANGLFVLTHAVFYAALVIVPARVVGVWTTGLTLPLILAVVGAGVFSLIALALGFLLPDFRRGAVFLPGASTIAKYLYVVASGMMVTYVFFAHLLLASGEADGATYAGMLTFITAVSVVVSVVISLWAVNRLRWIEL